MRGQVAGGASSSHPLRSQRTEALCVRPWTRLLCALTQRVRASFNREGERGKEGEGYRAERQRGKGGRGGRRRKGEGGTSKVLQASSPLYEATRALIVANAI